MPVSRCCLHLARLWVDWAADGGHNYRHCTPLPAQPGPAPCRKPTEVRAAGRAWYIMLPTTDMTTAVPTVGVSSGSGVSY